MNGSLTPKQKRIQDFIARCVEERGLPPTLREIGREFQVSAGTAQSQVAALEAKGALVREKGHARGARPAPAPGADDRIPILGRVGAGAGILAQENVESYFSITQFTLGTDFLLRVRGDSMIDEGILEGDLVQVRRQPTADDGDIVVALVGEEGVVKRLRRTVKGYVLESANPRYRPISTHFQVVGKVMGLVRKYGRS